MLRFCRNMPSGSTPSSYTECTPILSSDAKQGFRLKSGSTCTFSDLGGEGDNLLKKVIASNRTPLFSDFYSCQSRKHPCLIRHVFANLSDIPVTGIRMSRIRQLRLRVWRVSVFPLSEWSPPLASFAFVYSASRLICADR